MGAEHVVGLRELRHETGKVLRRVRAGESIDITDRGTRVARLVPIGESERQSPLHRLRASGRLSPAARAGGEWPAPAVVDDTDPLSAEVEDARTERV